MTFRPPVSQNRNTNDPVAAALEHEVFNEKAATLSRMTRRLEKALKQLEIAENKACPDLEEISRRHAAACETLWFLTIQRELCGLLSHKVFYDHMKVPNSVRLNMGPSPYPAK